MNQLIQILERSSELSEAIAELLVDTTIYEGTRAEVALGMCNISFEHSDSLRLLSAAGFFTSSISLLRPQFETLLRASWLWHAASDDQLSLINTSLTLESQQAAKKMRPVVDMLKDLERNGPRGASRLFARFRDRLGDGLNSFLHGGIHPLQRAINGYPEILLIDVIKNSNALLLLALLVTAELGDNVEIASSLVILNKQFGDILPALEPFPED